MPFSTQTRAKLKEAYDLHFAATIERAEKQIILAKSGRMLLNYLDDEPVAPGTERSPFGHQNEARQVLNDAEQELQTWRPNLEPIQTSAGQMSNTLLPAENGEKVKSPTSIQSSEANTGKTASTQAGQQETTSTPETTTQQTDVSKEPTAA